MNVVYLMQARTNSSRLPAKVLLPLAGYPLVVLAAKRAANRGSKVIVVTSNEDTDDYLCEVLQKYSVPYFRGSLNNTLNRFVKALDEYDDATVVVRLTADNSFPDDAFIKDIVEEFNDKQLNYLCTTGEISGLPYGFSVEVMKLSTLREADEKADTELQKEHVTPYVIEKFGRTIFTKYRALDLGHLRCTIDNLEDYLSVASVFENCLSPVDLSGLELANKLKLEKRNQEVQLVFGCAQLGLEYGINNKTGMPDASSSKQLLKKAYEEGMRYLDTARVYGDSELVIGTLLSDNPGMKCKVITKLSPLDSLCDSSSIQEVNTAVESSIFQSLDSLKQQKIYCLMLHRADHLEQFGGNIWRRLLRFKELGVIENLGVSVQTPHELLKALRFSEINYIQMPFNLLDHRWDSVIEQVTRCKKIRELKVHVRSVFLQGLLVSPDEMKWKKANYNDAFDAVSWLNTAVKFLNRQSIADLCLAYVRSHSWVDGVALGMETIEQLEQNINMFNLPRLTKKEIVYINESRPLLSDKTLNPAEWS